MFGVRRVNETKIIYSVVETKRFIVISFLKQTLFLFTLMDVETKLFLDQSGRQW